MSNIVLLLDDAGSAGAGSLMKLARLGGRSLTELRERIGSGAPVLDAPLFEGDEGFAQTLHALLVELDAASAIWRAWEVPFGEVWSEDEAFWEVTPERLTNLIRSEQEIVARARLASDREIGDS